MKTDQLHQLNFLNMQLQMSKLVSTAKTKKKLYYQKEINVLKTFRAIFIGYFKDKFKNDFSKSYCSCLQFTIQIILKRAELQLAKSPLNNVKK